jgi:protein-S-isoprenylcysteine O-methyltransferase Ste14
MPTDAAHHRWWQTADVVFGLPFLAALALQRTVPLALPRGFLTPAFVGVGATLIGAGVTVIILARRELARLHQPTDPGRPTSTMVTTGVFAVSRNPMYLGAACVLLGIALAFNLPWLLVLLAPALIACRTVLIAPEERYLAAKFGADYRSYAAAVHRWVGHARRPRSPSP